MIHAILTVDDISTKNTKMIVDYLNEKKITAVMLRGVSSLRTIMRMLFMHCSME